MYIYTFQKLNPKYCLFAFEIGYFGHHAYIKWKNFLKFLYKKFKIGGLWCCNKVLHNIVYQMPFTIFWYLNPEFCLTMSPVCLLYIIVHSREIACSLLKKICPFFGQSCCALLAWATSYILENWFCFSSSLRVEQSIVSEVDLLL